MQPLVTKLIVLKFPEGHREGTAGHREVDRTDADKPAAVRTHRGMVANAAISDTGARGPRVRGQLGLYKIMSQMKKVIQKNELIFQTITKLSGFNYVFTY